MSLSFAHFILSLILIQQLLRFSKVNKIPGWEKRLRTAFVFPFFLIVTEASLSATFVLRWIWYLFLAAFLIYSLRMKEMRPLRMFFLGFVPYIIISFAGDVLFLIDRDFFNSWVNYFSNGKLLALIWFVAILFSHFRQRKAAEKEQIERQHQDELNRAIAMRKVELEELVAERTAEITRQKEELELTINELRSMQSQLVYSEKMASLGELTAGIAHEIQNPLNFVTNFSEANTKLIDELQQVIVAGKTDEAVMISNEMKKIGQKVFQHGKRADAIVKGMLQHSRSSSGVKEPADINALADEFLRLSYHGLRAKDKSFNATMKIDFDPGIGKVNIIPQEMGRVILNVINNAFYAVREKKKLNIPGYEPTVSVSTKKAGDKVEIIIRDNGMGIPADILPKIFQPFFTTKPAGEGTGLGLSLSYDIITKVHDGEMIAETEEGVFTQFIIRIPENVR